MAVVSVRIGPHATSDPMTVQIPKGAVLWYTFGTEPMSFAIHWAETPSLGKPQARRYAVANGMEVLPALSAKNKTWRLRSIQVYRGEIGSWSSIGLGNFTTMGDLFAYLFEEVMIWEQ